METSDTNETTPALPKQTFQPMKTVNKLNQTKKEIRTRTIQKMENKVQSSNRRLEIFSYCFRCCVIGTFGLIIFAIYYYYSSRYEEREHIDETESIVHQQLKDYTTNELVNCSNASPCRGWSCLYVRDHFNKIPDECKYYDHMRLVTILLILVGLAACIEFLK